MGRFQSKPKKNLASKENKKKKKAAKKHEQLQYQFQTPPKGPPQQGTSNGNPPPHNQHYGNMPTQQPQSHAYGNSCNISGVVAQQQQTTQRKKCRERLHPALLQSQFNATTQTARLEQQMMIKYNRNIVAGPPMKQQQQQHQHQQQMQGGPGQVLMQRPAGFACLFLNMQQQQQQHMVLSEERVTGTVTTEVGTGQQGRISYENRGECFFLPYGKDDVEGNVTLSVGDKVSFQIATSYSGNLGARYIRLENPAHPVRYQGVVCSLKESFGFIECGDVVREIFFHFSEAKGIADTMELGDDVEFTIQTRNGKEVACSIIKLPSGTVVFEDVNHETLKGQVLKPLERGANVAALNTEPLSGRLRYRGRDRSEVEIPFGDKDQKGEYTLRHGDWVQFNIAVDRRDKLERATNIELQDESFVVSGEKRETGVVAAVKEGYGFIKCAERDAMVFFHFSEVISLDEEVDQNSEVEFTMSQDQKQPNKQSAVRIKVLPPGSVQFELITQQNIVGTVTREPSTSPVSGLKGRSNSKSTTTTPIRSHKPNDLFYRDGSLSRSFMQQRRPQTQVRQHPYGLPMCPSSPQVAISRGGPVQSPRMIHQLASSTQMMTTPKPSPSQQMQMPGKVFRQVQKQQQQRLMPAPSPSPSMMMTHSQHGSMNEGGGPMTPVTITPRGTGKQQPQPSTMPSPNTAIPMNRKNFNRSTGRNFKGPAKLPKEKTPEKLPLPETIYRPTPPMSMNTTLVAKLVRLVGTERTLKKTSKTKAVAAPIQTSNRSALHAKSVPWLISNECLSNEPNRYQAKYVLYMEKDHSDVVDSSSSNELEMQLSSSTVGVRVAAKSCSNLENIEQTVLLDTSPEEVLVLPPLLTSHPVSEKGPLDTVVIQDDDMDTELEPPLTGCTPNIENKMASVDQSNPASEIGPLDTVVIQDDDMDTELEPPLTGCTPNIENKMASVDQQYEQPKQLAVARQKKLDNSQMIHKFLREADEVANWINEQMAMAALEGYGRDLEHVEILIQKFEGFLSTLNANQYRIELLKAAAKVSTDDTKIDSAKIRAKVDEVNQLWDDLYELLHARQDALSGAKRVHVFNSNADKTVTWITEKEATLYSDVSGQDLKGVQALLRKHAGFEHDLVAVKEQVDAVIDEAQILSDLFPDARDNIAIRHGETLRAWHDLLENGAQRKDKLQQAETLQAYFDDYRDLMAWFSEMIDKINAPELARECASAALQLAGHREYQTEIEARKEPFDRFVHMGEALIGKGHFMAEEIQDKVMTLTQRRHQLLETWQRREEIYLCNMDTLLFERDAQVDIHVHADASNLATANAEVSSDFLPDIQLLCNAVLESDADFDAECFLNSEQYFFF